MVMGAAGAQALGRGAKVAGHQGLAMGVAGLRAADGRIRAGVPVVWEASQAFGRKVISALGILWAVVSGAAQQLAAFSAPHVGAGWRRMQPALAKLRKPGVAAVLALIAAVAFVGSFRRIAANGFDGDIFIALLIGAMIAFALIAAWLADGAPEWLAAALRGVGRGAGRGASRLASASRKVGPARARIARGGAMVAVVLVVIGAGWLVWRASAALPSLMTDASSTLKGRAVAVSGDTLRVARTTVALSGIEAPIDGQTCVSDDARRWRCDAAAETALARLLRSGPVTCELSGADDSGRRSGTCLQGERDVAAELVRNGHVFAQTGFLSSYGSLENEAQAAKAGIWGGEAARPSDYRAQKWEEAKREAPEGCPIKGKVTGGRRIYVLPWARDYERVKITGRRGERWFCSEDEALAAGWKPSKQS
jgi:endonuclease YncB( thermonuclease family)